MAYYYGDEEETMTENDRLWYASRDGKNEDVKKHIKNGADINHAEGFCSVLGIAANNGHESTVQLLLELGAKVDKSSKDGMTPLHWSCRHGHTACAELLIKSGCNIEACDMKRQNAMHHACEEGHLNIIQLLISKGLSLDTPTDKSGRTSKMILRENYPYRDDINQRRRECLKALKDDCVQPDTSTTEADIAQNKSLWSASSEGRNEDVKELVRRGADVNFDNMGFTVLGRTAACGHESTVQLLIQLGANVDKKGMLQMSPLLCSCMNGHTACAELLIKSGCNVEACDPHGRSPIHWSCWNGHAECTELLINSGCNIETTEDYSGRNVMYYACDGGRLNIIRLLLSKGLSLDIPTDKERLTGRMILREIHHDDDVTQRRKECLKALEEQLNTSTAAADTTIVQ